MDLRARGCAGLPRDRRLHRADRTRRDRAAARRPRGRPGPGRRPDHDRRRVGVRSRRRPHELLPRPSPRPCLHGQARRRRCRSPRRAWSRSSASSIATAARRSSSGASSGLVRAVAPFMAGSSGMPLRRFVPYDVIGAGLWGSTFVVLGYVFWQSFSQLVDYAKKGALALGAVIVLVVAIVWLVRWVRDPDNRAAHARVDGAPGAAAPRCARWSRVLAPVLRTTRRPARFVWDRVTPGDLGLELTTLFAVAGVGAFVFVWDLVRIEQDNGLLAGDAASLRLADRLHMDALVNVAKVVTALGSLPVAIALVALAGATLVWRHELRDALALVAGLALTYAAVHITKDAVDRPRPARALVDTDGAAYPVGPRRVRGDVGRGRRRAQPRAAQRRLALRLRHGGDRDRARGRPEPDLPARALPLRRRRRVGRWAPRSSPSAAAPRWSSATCGTMHGRPTPPSDEQRVDHLPRRRVQRRVRPGRLRRPHRRARLDGLQPHLGAPGGHPPHALRAGRVPDPGRRRRRGGYLVLGPRLPR